MLVLARRKNEAIKIGPDITITVLRIKGKAVKLGIEAPGNVWVVRAELLGRSGEPRCDTDAPTAAPENDCGSQGPPGDARPTPDSDCPPMAKTSLRTRRGASCATRRRSRLARRGRAVPALF